MWRELGPVALQKSGLPSGNPHRIVSYRIVCNTESSRHVDVDNYIHR